MNKNKAVFLDLESVHRGDLDLSGLHAAIQHWDLYAHSRQTEIINRIKNATVVVANKSLLSREILLEAKNLRLICVAATGTNNVDIDAAVQQKIQVCNVRDYATPSVVQHVFTLILALCTKFVSYRQAVQAKQWQNGVHFCLLDFPIQELAGKTIGVVGYGVLGHAVAEIAKAFGMNIMIAERKGQTPRRGRCEFEEMLKTVDVLTLHCPLNDHTKDLIGKRELKNMKSSAILINTARGGIVDEKALLNALNEKQIAGAGIDVLSVEPPVGGNVLLENNLPNLIITPHIAWASLESRQRLINEIEKNIRAFLCGEPRNLVC